MSPDFPDKPLSPKAQRRVELATSRLYRLRTDEELAGDVRRIARGRVERAVEQLRNANGDPATAIHEARKDMKKLRSLLRLVRADLGKQRYRAENSRYRDAARLLSGARDAAVKLATLAALRERYTDEAPAAERLEQTLREEHERVAADGEALAARMEQAAQAIETGAVDDWSLDDDGFELFAAGLERAYRRGRDGMRAVRDDPDDETIHEWRKRVKDLWYDLRLLRDAWPEPLKATADEAHELTDLLGDHHDLAVLIDDARAKAPDDPDTEALAKLAARRQEELLGQAFRIGDRLYAEKPSQFTRRIERYWETWRRGAAQ